MTDSIVMCFGNPGSMGKKLYQQIIEILIYVLVVFRSVYSDIHD